jgi:hypothetical protein
MSQEEYQLWFEDYQQRPWGETQREMSQALCFASVLNAIGSKASVDDLIPKWHRPAGSDQLAWDVFRIVMERK